MFKTASTPKISNLFPYNLTNYDLTDNNPPTTKLTTQISNVNLDYSKLEDRIKSYSNWPNKDVSKETLAEAGFVYKNRDDIVQCPFCRTEGYQWVAGDNPMDDHRNWSPNCPFVRRSVEHDNASPSSSNSTLGGDTCGLYGIEILPNSIPEDTTSSIDLTKLGIHRNRGPTHPEKFSYESRLRSFENWPKAIKQTPHDLSEAGFFYLGVGDQTLCFHCGGGLKDWEPRDDVWEQHALWFPTCSFLLMTKGQQFVDTVQKRYDVKHTKESEPESKEEENTVVTVTQPQASTKEVTTNNNNNSSNSDSKTLCKICLKNELEVVFLPCGHIVACVECAAALKTCAICRKKLEATVRAFLS